jgi:hypothetical protein
MYRYQVARTLRALGRYADLAEHLERYPLAADAAARLQGDLAYNHGHLEEWAQGPLHRARVQRASGNHRIASENETVALWRTSLAGLSPVADCETLIAEADRCGQHLSLRSGLAAKALHVAGSRRTFDAVRAEQLAIVEATGGYLGWRELSSALVHALRSEDSDLIADTRATWTSRERTWSPNYQLVDRLFVRADHPPTFAAVSMGTPEETEAVETRWHSILDRLLSHPARP